jgi:hypothetical protein
MTGPKLEDLCAQCCVPAAHPGHPLANHTLPGPYGLGCELPDCNCAEFTPYRTDCQICGTPLSVNDPLGVCTPEHERASDGLVTWRFLQLMGR